MLTKISRELPIFKPFVSIALFSIVCLRIFIVNFLIFITFSKNIFYKNNLIEAIERELNKSEYLYEIFNLESVLAR